MVVGDIIGKKQPKKSALLDEGADDGSVRKMFFGKGFRLMGCAHLHVELCQRLALRVRVRGWRDSRNLENYS